MIRVRLSQTICKSLSSIVSHAFYHNDNDKVHVIRMSVSDSPLQAYDRQSLSL